MRTWAPKCILWVLSLHCAFILMVLAVCFFFIFWRLSHKQISLLWREGNGVWAKTLHVSNPVNRDCASCENTMKYLNEESWRSDRNSIYCVIDFITWGLSELWFFWLTGPSQWGGRSCSCPSLQKHRSVGSRAPSRGLTFLHCDEKLLLTSWSWFLHTAVVEIWYGRGKAFLAEIVGKDERSSVTVLCYLWDTGQSLWRQP